MFHTNTPSGTPVTVTMLLEEPLIKALALLTLGAQTPEKFIQSVAFNKLPLPLISIGVKLNVSVELVVLYQSSGLFRKTDNALAGEAARIREKTARTAITPEKQATLLRAIETTLTKTG
jgi:hypothetical protein